MMENSPQQTDLVNGAWSVQLLVDIIITVSMQLYKMQPSSLHIINKII